MQILCTDRLALRLFNINDAAFVYQLLNDPSWIKNIGDREIIDLEKARAWMNDGPHTSQLKHGFSFYAVTLRESGVTIGICGLIKRDVLAHVDIGYAFLPDYCGHGYAFEAAQATMKYAHENLGLPKLAAITSPENRSSNKLLKKLGFVLEEMITLTLSGVEKHSNLYGYSFSNIEKNLPKTLAAMRGDQES